MRGVALTMPIRKTSMVCVSHALLVCKTMFLYFQNFSQFLFNWYIREGKPGHLLERFRSHAKPPQQEQLSQFLGDHPSLSWLQDVLSQDFIRAYSTLEGIAHNEKDLFQRKKVRLLLTYLE